LSHKFVTDAREIVKTGDIVKVQVVEVDVARKRIALSMKLGAAPARRDGGERQPGENRFQGLANNHRGRAGGSAAGHRTNAPQSTAMSSAFAKLKGAGV
jgi:uncharacterized protein